MQIAPGEHSAILSTFIKLPFVFTVKNFDLSIFEWPLKTDFTVHALIMPGLFQLLYTGMLETTKIRREGFAVRPLFEEFVKK